MSTTETDSSAAGLARASLRYLAERHLPPTPDQYRRAWQSVGGASSPYDAVAAGTLPSGAAIAQQIGELLQLLEIPHRNWTRARKREALNRLLANNQADAGRLFERLGSLLSSWKADCGDRVADTGEPAARTGDVAEPIDGTDALQPVQVRGTSPQEAGALGAPDPREGLRGLLAEMTRLLVTICETVPQLVEEEAWVRRQFGAIRATLDPRSGHPDRRGLVRTRDVLRRTAEEHQRLLKMRRDSLQMMKSMIAQCIEWLRALTESSDRYGAQLNVYVERIQNAPDLPALAGTVHELIEQTRTIYGELDASRRDFAAAGERARQLEEEVDRLAQDLASASAQVMTDHLTSLLNRRGFETSFDEVSARCRASGRTLSLVLLDIDDFKQVNDAWGHQAGDAALSRLAGLLKSRLRPCDLSARYGGEEFVVLLPDLDAEEAAAVMRRLQLALTAEVIQHRCERVLVTFSAGVAQLKPDETLAQAVARADDAMYKAKRSGKNRVYVAAARPAAGLIR